MPPFHDHSDELVINQTLFFSTFRTSALNNSANCFKSIFGMTWKTPLDRNSPSAVIE